MADNARKLVEDVLSPNMTREIWSLNYDKVLPISLYAVSNFPRYFQQFSICFVSDNVGGVANSWIPLGRVLGHSASESARQP